MPSLHHHLRRVLTAQATTTLALTTLILLVTAASTGTSTLPTLGLTRTKAVAFGAAIGMLTTIATARSVLKSTDTTKHTTDAGTGIIPLYTGLAIKLTLVAGGTLFGMTHLNLSPLLMLLGYLTMQLGYAWAALRPSR